MSSRFMYLAQIVDITSIYALKVLGLPPIQQQR